MAITLVKSAALRALAGEEVGKSSALFTWGNGWRTLHYEVVKKGCATGFVLVGSFFLTDFLAQHFDRLVWKGLGLDKNPKLVKLYFANYTRLLYLAQSENPKIHQLAEQAAEKLGLRFEIHRTGYGGFETFLASLKELAD